MKKTTYNSIKVIYDLKVTTKISPPELSLFFRTAGNIYLWYRERVWPTFCAWPFNSARASRRGCSATAKKKEKTRATRTRPQSWMPRVLSSLRYQSTNPGSSNSTPGLLTRDSRSVLRASSSFTSFFFFFFSIHVYKRFYEWSLN